MNSPWSSALLESIKQGSQWEGSLYFPTSNVNLLQAWNEAFSQAPSNVCVQTSDGSPVQTSGKGSIISSSSTSHLSSKTNNPTQPPIKVIGAGLELTPQSLNNTIPTKPANTSSSTTANALEPIKVIPSSPSTIAEARAVANALAKNRMKGILSVSKTVPPETKQLSINKNTTPSISCPPDTFKSTNEDLPPAPQAHASIVPSKSTLNKDISNKNNCGEIDIIRLLSPNKYPALSTQINLNIVLHQYPKGAVFHFEGYSGIKDKEKLINDLKDRSIANGTKLVIGQTDKNDQYQSYTLTCQHCGKRKSSNVQFNFNNNQIQASNTIIQEAHSASSVKGRSRNATYKRVPSNEQTDHSSYDNICLQNSIKCKVNEPKKNNRSQSMKCNCSFNFTIYLEISTQRWFLRSRQRYLSGATSHTNHVWIPPELVMTSKDHLNPAVQSTIHTLLDSGTSVPNIKHFVRVNFKVHISESTLYNMQYKQIQTLLNKCFSQPYGTPVDTLTNIFSTSKNVSFIYVVHRHNSGFVTFRKQQRMPVSIVKEQENPYRFDNEFSVSVKNWRESLQLAGTNDVLVAFAWAHDEELKNTQMFPEVLCMDITFGVNRQRRELFTVCGIDGHNKVFTSFRCFIPSKQEHCYSWILKQAMPHILTPQILQHNRYISTDQEQALNNAIIGAKSCDGVSFKFSAFRLDCFHMFKSPWRKDVCNKIRDTEEASYAVKVMEHWILSWFNYVESKYELQESLKRFETFCESQTEVVGLTACEGIQSMVTKLLNKQQNLFHLYFKNVLNFDFLGDSIVEAANTSLKSGPVSTSSTMDISKSGMTILKSTEAKAATRKVEMGNDINKVKNWTRSSSSDFLTAYMEGITCRNWNRTGQYTTRVLCAQSSWMVAHSDSLFDDSPPDKNLPTRFTRVRVVELSQNKEFMTCSCGYPNRWLAPCVHILVVLAKTEYCTQNLFHIRWWKHFNFFFRSSNCDGTTLNPNKNIVENLRKTLHNVRECHFNKDNGQWHGVPMNGSRFLEDKDSYYFKQPSIYDDVRQHMLAFKKMNDLNIATIRGESRYKEYLTIDQIYDSSSDSFFIGNDEEKETDDAIPQFERTESNGCLPKYDSMQPILSPDECLSMGAGSRAESNLSQFRQDILTQDSFDASSNRTIVPEHMQPYSVRLQPFLSDMIERISSEAEYNAIKNMILKATYDLGQCGKKCRQIQSTETSMLGEFQSSGRQEKRRKYGWENKR